jgi:hypothetical protein
MPPNCAVIELSFSPKIPGHNIGGTMKRNSLFVFLLSGTLVLGLFLSGCTKKESNPASPGDPSNLYWVMAVILNPSGQPQGGALLALKNPPQGVNGVFSANSDSLGKASVQSPSGAQTLVVSIGSAFLSEIQVNVAASSGGTNAGTVTLHQNTTVKVLVVHASAEQLEDVLRDPKIGFNTFDETTIYALIDSANTDTTRLLNYLKQYTLIFSDCDGGSEGSSDYERLSLTYGKYVQQGGKMYGGHYNYYHLQRIWPTYYTTGDYQGNSSNDSLSIVDANLSTYVGFSVAKWISIDSRGLSGYEKFSNLPANTKIYGVIRGTSPAVAVIAENRIGLGKYLWTDYHNQDIKDDPQLIKLVQYFLYSL